MEKKKRFNYIRKKLADGTWFRVIITVISFILLVACLAVSTVMEGKGPMYVGAMGMTSVIFAVYAVLDMIPRAKDPEKNYLPSRIAGSISGLIVIIWISLIVIGFINFS
ncbi:hypothetical protein BXO88_03370 [Oribacterium sp. C9]|uniref:hypothetical protein n=1 Tax=Oribacterium sp. C9 TaxID=1943579 RepID=UPI00098F7322|nr:hypothetical protein [Oribacterium sp. C9]OON87719.1 hypothetical protein BXO88_03370 [Oribacterium sp. C9]